MSGQGGHRHGGAPKGPASTAVPDRHHGPGEPHGDDAGPHHRGHGGGDHHAAHGHHGHGSPPSGEPATGLVKDPVCGMTVDPRTAKHRAEHGGQTYHFCSARCRERFAADPGKYVAPAAASTASPPG